MLITNLYVPDASPKMKTDRASYWIAPMLLSALLMPMLACGGSGSSGSRPATTPVAAVNPNASGNWQLQLTSTSGVTLFPVITGYIKDDVTDTTSTKYSSAELTATATTGCFSGQNPISAGGTIAGALLALTSLSINGQFLYINATLDAESATMSGSYQVQGGCADGAAGTLVGARYAPLTGTYNGSLDATPVDSLQLTLTQNGQGNGNGTFLVSGSGTLTGLPCFTTATLNSPAGFVTGSSLQLPFSTADPSGAQLVLKGTFDVAADTVTLSSIEVTSGTCAGSYGTATLKLHS